jgi:hypothetical protein
VWWWIGAGAVAFWGDGANFLEKEQDASFSEEKEAKRLLCLVLSGQRKLVALR